jgi:hypothetical protein
VFPAQALTRQDATAVAENSPIHQRGDGLVFATHTLPAFAHISAPTAVFLYSLGILRAMKMINRQQQVQR